MIIQQCNHTDNPRNNISVLGERPIDYINGSIGATDKNFSINFSKEMTKFCLSLN